MTGALQMMRPLFTGDGKDELDTSGAPVNAFPSVGRWQGYLGDYVMTWT